MKRKRILAWVLAGTMLATGFGTYANATQGTGFSLSESDENPLELIDSILEPKENANNLEESIYSGIFDNDAIDPDEEVRVIVELETEPITSTEGLSKNKTKLEEEHEQVKNKIKTKDVKADVRHEYYMGVNGFSMDTRYKDIKEIEELPEVKSVTIARTFERDMVTSKDIVNTQKVWEELDLQGEGVVVAVLDSGIDYTHQDMTLTEKGLENAKLNEENLQDVFDRTEVDEEYFTDKIPTGYDWADKNSNVIPAADSHGMHVAGTIGANGDEDSDGVVGIAPGAQIVAQKVFGDYSAVAYEDDLVAAILHSIEVGADVINMSLGSPSGFVTEERDFIQKATKTASEQGVIVVATAGNDFYSTANSRSGALPQVALPYASNPDIGITGAPGVSPYALQVASYENTNIRINEMLIDNDVSLGYSQVDDADVVEWLGENSEYDLVYVGNGWSADYEGIDAEGKIVVVKSDYPGTGLYLEQNAAADNGAKGIVYVPHEWQGDYAYKWRFHTQSNKMPVVVPTMNDGMDIIERLESGEDMTISFSGDVVWAENTLGSGMSSFSSWGTPHDLSFKPEITAPGGQIYSTILGGEYDVYSGTSMAAPHVAGGAALLVQAMNEYDEIDDLDSVLMSKILLMNTAKVIINEESSENVPYSPRKQGAGMMQIDKSIETPAMIYSINDLGEKDGAVELKEIKEDKFEFTVTLEAFEDESNKKLAYDVYVDLLTDEIVTKEYDNNGDGEINKVVDALTTNSVKVNGATVKVDNKKVSEDKGAKVSVKPGEKVELTVEIDLSTATNLHTDTFIEGFIRLEPAKNTEATSLVIPYMGFYGDWAGLAGIDAPAYEDGSFIGHTALWDDRREYEPMGLVDAYTLEFDTEQIGVSPWAFSDGIFPSFTVLRNLDNVEIYIEDENGEIITEIINFEEEYGDGRIGKNVMARDNLSYTLAGLHDTYWRGFDLNGDVLPDGGYNYVIKSTVAYDGAEPETIKIPIKVDTQGPVISNINVEDLENGMHEISWDAEDVNNGTGYREAYVWVNGQTYLTWPDETSVQIYTGGEEVTGALVAGIDHAGNFRYYTWGDYEITNELITLYRVYGEENCNFTNPITIYAGAQMYMKDWTINILDPNGEIIDVYETEYEIGVFNLDWKPEKGMPDGEYTVEVITTDIHGQKSFDRSTFNVKDNGGV